MESRGSKSLQDALDTNPPSYILITCGHPSEENGQMQVEMTYQGLNAALVSYLLEEAQSFVNHDDEEDDELPSPHPIQLFK